MKVKEASAPPVGFLTTVTDSLWANIGRALNAGPTMVSSCAADRDSEDNKKVIFSQYVHQKSFIFGHPLCFFNCFF